MSPKPSSFEEAVRLFNQQQFFECHEVLEDLWRPLPPGADKTFLQGLIQIAVGFHHLQNQNYIGARNKIREGLQKLQSTSSQLSPHPLVMDRFCNECHQALTLVHQLGQNRLQEFPTHTLPTLNT